MECDGINYLHILLDWFWRFLNMHFSIYGIDLTFWKIAVGCFAMSIIGGLFWYHFLSDDD